MGKEDNSGHLLVGEEVVYIEPLEPEEPRKCYGNQVGCILRECASINDDDLRSKEHLTQLLLTKLHKRFKFPDQDDNIEQPWDDPKMKKINNHAMGMFMQ